MSGLLQMRDQGIKRIEIKTKVLHEHNFAVQKNLQKTVLNRGGCKSYYLDQNRRNFAAWSWSLKQLKRKLKKFDLVDYDVG
jgi:hypothetical protein